MDLSLKILRYGGKINLIYDTLSNRDKENFKRVCNKLLSYCLLCKAQEENKNDYYFIENNKEAINEYFAPLGYEVEVNKNIKVAQLVNTFGYNKYNFKLVESITLLILRILYQEKMQELSLSQQVVVEVEELQNRFVALNFKDRIMDKTLLKKALRTLKKYNIIDTLDKNMLLGNSRIIIYPTNQTVVRGENVDKVYEKLETYKRKGVKDNEETDRN